MSFIEREWPRAFLISPVGGPSFSSDVKAGDSPFEQVNAKWSIPRGQWQLAFSGKDQDFYDAIQDFFYALKGKANRFRFFWHADFQATDEFFGTGDGVTTAFQLQKTYAQAFGAEAVAKPISKPIMADVVDYEGEALTDTVVIVRTRNGTPTTLVKTTDYTVDSTTGVVTFVSAPNSAATNGGVGHTGDILTWSGQFHFPVRLDQDNWPAELTTPQDGGIKYRIQGLRLIEVAIKPVTTGA